MVTSLPQAIEIEEKMMEEFDPQQLQADKVSKERKIPKEPQKSPHDTKARTLGQENIETPTVDFSQ